jgi:hypothetical protein
MIFFSENFSLSAVPVAALLLDEEELQEIKITIAEIASRGLRCIGE